MFEPGQTLLHYRLVEQIGAGGMGVIWRARDTTLDREVAVKFLPPDLASDAERLARFEREARLLASLNHPNIATVHGLHEHEGQRFLAMELVPGNDLSEHLLRGPLPVRDALDAARQIAEALEAAHDAGVIHRDLKPANVKLTPDGKVKVLDFGLAKGTEQARGEDSLSMSPTMTSAGSVAGMLLGTAAYMSPEQARGLPVDRQADVWALGCVLYELLTGKQTFAGQTVTDVLAAVVQQEPDWNALPQACPPGAVRLLKRCLQKDLKRRLRDAGDVARMLEEAAAEPPRAEEPRTTGKPGRLWPTIAVIAILVLAVMLATGWSLRGGDEPPPRVTAMEQLTDLPGEQRSPSLSSDGEQLLYVDRDGGDLDIFLQRVGGENPINLTADYADDDYQPAFSPDRRWIAFGSRREGGGIFVMGATGETPRRVADEGFDPAWSPDGTRLIYTTERINNAYSRTGPAALWVVDLETRERKQLHDIDAAGADWSPGGGRIAFWTHSATAKGQRDIWTIDADGRRPVQVTDDVHTDWDPVWSPDGQWLYFLSDRGGSSDVWRVKLDERTGRVRGEPQPVTSGVAKLNDISLAGDGLQLAVTAARVAGEIQVVGFDPVRERTVGTPSTIVSSLNPFVQHDVSPDGEWIAYRTAAPREVIYVVRVDGTGRRKVLDDQYRNRGPEFSNDGEWILFYSNRNGTYQSWAIRPDGTDLRVLVDDPTWDGRGPIRSTDPDLYYLSMSVADSDALALGAMELDADRPGGPAEAVTRELPGGSSFNPSEVSPDGSKLVGRALDGRGESAVAIYDVEAETFELPRQADGRVFRIFGDGAWLDDHRVVFWDQELDALIVWDTGLGEAREIPGIAGPAEPEFTDGGRTLVLNRKLLESDVWLLTLED